MKPTAVLNPIHRSLRGGTRITAPSERDLDLSSLLPGAAPQRHTSAAPTQGHLGSSLSSCRFQLRFQARNELRSTAGSHA